MTPILEIKGFAAAVIDSNKMARAVWAMMTRKENYRDSTAAVTIHRGSEV